jgi:hypothetical protein
MQTNSNFQQGIVHLQNMGEAAEKSASGDPI